MSFDGLGVPPDQEGGCAPGCEAMTQIIHSTCDCHLAADTNMTNCPSLRQTCDVLMTTEQGAMTSNRHNINMDPCGCDFTAA